MQNYYLQKNLRQKNKIKYWPHTLVLLMAGYILLMNTPRIIMAGCREHWFLDYERPRKYMNENNYISLKP